MKRYLFLAALLAHFSLYGQPKAKIGMTVSEVKKLYTFTDSGSYQNKLTLSYADTLYGLADEWGYRFMNDSLNWIFFHKYIDDISQDNFDLCFSAAKNLIRDYSMSYGDPDTVIVGETTCKNPYKQKHWGYEVIEAQWKDTSGMKIDIKFSFFGGKGEYKYIVSVNFFDKNYPFFH